MSGVKLAKEFLAYCEKNPKMRFWQALRNWIKADYVIVDGLDTFYWNDKNII